MRSFITAAVLTILSGPFCNAGSKIDTTLGWAYGRADQGDGYADLNGWSGSVSYNVREHVGVTVEHQSFWGGYRGSALNQHAWLAGPTFKLRNPERKIIPFVQPLVGDTRSSSAGTIQHSFTVQVAAGVDIKIGSAVAVELIPAQYNYNRQQGSSLHSYQLGGGMQFSLGK
jgi:hypothetical protein